MFAMTSLELASSISSTYSAVMTHGLQGISEHYMLNRIGDSVDRCGTPAPLVKPQIFPCPF